MLRQTKINTLTLVLINVFAPVAMIWLVSWYMKVVTITFGLGILVYEGKYKRAVKFIVYISVLELLNYLLVNGYIPTIVLRTYVTPFVVCNNYMLTFMIASLLIYDTQSSNLIGALQHFHLPKNIVIAIVITFRYFPIFAREFKVIKEAMRIRGIEYSWKHPLQSFEYFIVPQLFRCQILAEEMTCAGLVRGLDAPCSRNSYFSRPLQTQDWVVVVCCFLMVVGGAYVKYCY